MPRATVSVNTSDGRAFDQDPGELPGVARLGAVAAGPRDDGLRIGRPALTQLAAERGIDVFDPRVDRQC